VLDAGGVGSARQAKPGHADAKRRAGQLKPRPRDAGRATTAVGIAELIPVSQASGRPSLSLRFTRAVSSAKLKRRPAAGAAGRRESYFFSGGGSLLTVWTSFVV
jgi:hypothetical protein